MRTQKRIKINVHPNFYNYLEIERKKLKEKGITGTSQANLTKMIAQRLSSAQKERGLGLVKRRKKYVKKK